ncbi:MAG TPA: energy transducer TonB [Holophaga sp.]|nr:energy transducer TonB [Holophaga sp.]
MRTALCLILGLAAAPLHPQAGVVGGTAPASPRELPGTVDTEFSQVKIVFQPPAPPYPPLAKIARIQGTVVVELLVGTDGIPVSARAIEGPVQLRATAEGYAMAWKFAPFLKDGAPQNFRFKLAMPFKLRDTALREGVLQLRLEAAETPLDGKRIAGMARGTLYSVGVAPVDLAKADPAKADSVGLDLRVTRLGEGDAYLCEARLRVSRLQDLMLASNTPGQPQQVWNRRAALVQRGAADLEEALAVLTREVCTVHYVNARPGEDLTLRYAAPADATRVVVQPRVLALPAAPAGKAGSAVKVRIHLDERGRPRRAQLITGPPELEEAALAYAMAVTCEPLKVDGAAKPGLLVIDVPFGGK